MLGRQLVEMPICRHTSAGKKKMLSRSLSLPFAIICVGENVRYQYVVNYIYIYT